MSQIEPYGSRNFGLSPRDARRVGRSVSGLQVGRAVRESRADVETDIVVAKIQNETMATGAGMSAVVQVAQGQQQLELLAPQAAGRLNMLADAHALGVAGTLADLRRRLSRI